MPAPTITPLPEAPQREDTPALFVTKADTFVAALEDLPTEINAFGDYLDGLALEGVTGPIADTSLTVSSGKLLGRSTAGTGAIEELTVGSGLTLAGGTLSAATSSYTDENAQDAVGVMVDGTLTYNDATPALGINTTAEAERIRDIIGAALVAGTNVTLTVNDAGDTITIAASGGVAPTTDATTARTSGLTDAGGWIEFTNAAAVAWTIPPNSTVAFPLGTQIQARQAGAGTVTITAGAGVTLNSRGGLVASAGQYAIFGVKKVATDTWAVIGDVA